MGFLDRFRRQPAGPAVATSADPRSDLAGWVAELVGPGFLTRAEAEHIVVEAVEEDPEGYPGLGPLDARAVLAEVWDRLAGRQAGWRDEGDYEPLRQAFGELESDGVVARMNFTCCGTCGHAEIGGERPASSWGYTFFHQQDSERLHPGGSDLFLAFGAFGPVPTLDPALVERARAGDDAARQEAVAQSDVTVARRVVSALERHGLQVDWDGTSGRRIRVEGLDWRKRLPVD
jgi:uncharacterized protein DUF6891